MKKSTKVLAAVLSLVLVATLSIGGTLAYLKASSGPVTNTFTFGNLSLDLTETTGTKYQLIPGADIKKDPKVTLTNMDGYDDVDAYVYVKVEEQDWPTAKISGTGTRKVSYTLADGWTPLPGVPNVYYREVKATDSVKSWPVLKDNKITVSETLTKEEISGSPTAKLIISAYAVQSDAMENAKDAWTKAGF